ncbi:uncharacterized protein [Nicotiana tomentosiformis]|uniref:uncharacterized protein n=1 Tax=Nicotiana tomentosiformis TaxID=4098 RepID=UPI00388C67D6
MKQGLAHVFTYYSKLKDLWDEYDAMIPTPSCLCPESKVFLEYIQQQRLVQFLSGLNESFAQAKGQIMLMIPTLTINEAYAMVVQDDSQGARDIGPSALEIEAQAMAYNTRHGANTIVHNNGQGFMGGYKPKSQLYCDYCRMKGQTRDG